MSRRFPHIAVLVAWLLASGAQWDAVQVAGWTRMTVRYAESMSWSAALARTFSGELCGVCEVVGSAKRDRTDTPGAAPRDAKLVLFAPAPLSLARTAPAVPLRAPRTRSFRSADRAAPPLPPPRA